MKEVSKHPPRFNRLQHVFLMAFLAPLAVQFLLLKSIRVFERGNVESVLQFVDLFKSEILLLSGFAVLGLTLLALARRTRIQHVLLIALQLMGLAGSFTDFAAHRFFQSTGSTLDFQLLSLALVNFSDIWQVISSEFKLAKIVPFGLFFVALMIAPWLYLYVLSRKTTNVSANTDPIKQRKSAQLLSGTAILAGVLFIGAIFPPFVEQNVPFSRASSINIILSVIPASNEDDLRGSKRRRVDNLQLVSKSDQTTPKNVAIIVLESTRARSVSAYNDTIDTTPFIRSLAPKSLVAERAYAVVPHTSKALVAILCGIEPQLAMPITESLPNGLPITCLPELLSQQGYETGFFQSATRSFENRVQLVDNMGFADFMAIEDMPKNGYERTNYFGFEDDIMLNPSKKWLKKRRKKPFLATYLTLTPHHNYTTPKHHKLLMYDENKEYNQYLNAINYTDGFVEKLIEQYKELGLYDDTVFVIVGDHGEGFGEHGRNQHDNVIYDEGVHIPLIIYDPANPEPRRIKEAVSQIDIVPTLVDHLGFDIINAELPGLIMTEIPEERRVFAHCWFEKRCMASIARSDKYIHHFDKQPDELYDMQLDLLEKNNIAKNNSDALKEYSAELKAWRFNVRGMHKRHHESMLDSVVFDTQPPVEHKLDAMFGDYVRLVGYTIHSKTIRPGDKFKISYVFNTTKRIPDNWKLFVHGVGPHDRMLLLDHIPAGGLHPTSDWKSDRFIVDEHEISVPSHYKSDSLKITLGFYHPKKGRAAVSGSIVVDDKGRAEVVEIPIIR